MSNRVKRNIKKRSRASVINRELEPTEKKLGGAYVPAAVKYFNPKLKDKVRFVTPKVFQAGGVCTFRVWNMLDPDSPSDALLDGRLNQYDSAGLVGMSISEPVFCADYIGVSPDTGIQTPGQEYPVYTNYIISKDKYATIEGVPFNSLPYMKIYNSMIQVLKSNNRPAGWDSSWENLVPTPFRKVSAGIKNPSKKYFAIVSLYENGGVFDLDKETFKLYKDGAESIETVDRNGVPLGEGSDDPLVVMCLPHTAGVGILNLCNETNPEIMEGGEDPSKMYILKDPCGKFIESEGIVKGGSFFSLFNGDKLPGAQKYCDSRFKLHNFVPSKGKEMFKSYSCGASSKFKFKDEVYSASLDADQVNNILNKNVFIWKEEDQEPDDTYLLHMPSIEERCVLLAEAFKPVAKLLKFCWMSTPEYLNFDSVSAIVNDRKSFAMANVVDDEEEEDEDEVEVVVKEAKKKPKSSMSLVKDYDSELAKEVSAKSKKAKADEFDEEDDTFDVTSYTDEAEEDESSDEVSPAVESEDSDDIEESLDNEEEFEVEDEVVSDSQEYLESKLAAAKAMDRSKKRRSSRK